jgi:hypothetical protein
MPYFPLRIPPGVVASGAPLASQGRWIDSSLIRWREGVLRPVGGWRRIIDDAATDPIRGMFAWRDIGGDRFLAFGTASELYATGPNLTPVDLTPDPLVVGRVDAVQGVAYGAGLYGDDGPYGRRRTGARSILPATTWAFDAWGELLLACHWDDGRILSWVPGDPPPAAVLTNAPTGCRSVLVTPERFVFALSPGGDPRRVAWADQDDPTVWTPAATNTAGDYDLTTRGRLLCGVRAAGRSLLLTDADAHAANYIGPPFIYGFEQVGDACGIVASKAVAVVEGAAYWMGHGGFFRWSGGAVEPLDCPVLDDVLRRMNTTQASKVWAVSNAREHEVWWFFPQSVEVDRYAAFNYRTGVWAVGALARTAGVDAAPWVRPIWSGADGTLYTHEDGNERPGADLPYATSGPIMLGAGDQAMTVLGFLADERAFGQTRLRFTVQDYPNGPERNIGPITLESQMPTDLRFTARLVSVKIEEVEAADWRFGEGRMIIKPRGRR